MIFDDLEVNINFQINVGYKILVLIVKNSEKNLKKFTSSHSGNEMRRNSPELTSAISCE